MHPHLKYKHSKIASIHRVQQTEQYINSNGYRLFQTELLMLIHQWLL